MKVLFLYEELAGYFMHCVSVFADAYNCEVLVFCKKANRNAPFQFTSVHPKIKISDRDEFTEQQMLRDAKTFSPDAVFVGGWAYKPYLNLVKKLKPKTTIIGFDNQWTGTLKQRLGAMYFKIFIKPFVQYAFVPGKEQSLFARKIGFGENRISEGAYCCEYELFDQYYHTYKAEKEKNFPKRFLYVGRYAKEKAVDDLWNVFIEWQKEKANDWELWCLGKGDVKPPAHSKIKHFGFLQPKEMGEIIKNAGVFILPSTFEPWGVVVHEYAVAGFPLLCTDKTGAASTFVEENGNGFIIEAGNKAQLKEKMNKFSTLNQSQLNAMAARSAEMGAKITPAIWAERLMKMCKHG